MEGKLLAAAIASRKAYDNIRQLGADSDLTEMGKQLWKRLAAYYDRDNDASSADVDLLLEQLVRAHPAHQEKFEALINNLPKVSPPNVVDYCREHRLQCLALTIQNALDKSDSDKAVALMEEYVSMHKIGFTTATTAVGAKVYQGVTSHQLREELNQGSGLKLYPPALGHIVYDLLPGDHILVYASPETGKSLTAITMACGFAYQGKRVLYVGNEDPAMRMIGRIKSCLSGMTKEQRDEAPEECDRRAKARGFDNIIFVELSPGTTDDIEKLVREHKPDVCVVDQVLNLRLSGGKQPSETERLEHTCQRLRMLYKAEKVIGISISQADGQAVNKLQLGIENVYYSNIGVQGQVDVMIGVGMNHDFEASGRRYLNVTKNKASGRHAGCTVRCNFGISKLEDLNR